MKVMFVCLGNICRSPMAEMIFKELVRERGLESSFSISSTGISNEEEGNDIYPPAQKKLLEKGIPIQKRQARKITQEDIVLNDYIIVMENYQRERILKSYSIEESKIKMLNEKDVADPWYSGNFELTYQEIYESCQNLLKELEKKL